MVTSPRRPRSDAQTSREAATEPFAWILRQDAAAEVLAALGPSPAKLVRGRHERLLVVAARPSWMWRGMIDTDGFKNHPRGSTDRTFCSEAQTFPNRRVSHR